MVAARDTLFDRLSLITMTERQHPAQLERHNDVSGIIFDHIFHAKVSQSCARLVGPVEGVANVVGAFVNLKQNGNDQLREVVRPVF